MTTRRDFLMQFALAIPALASYPLQKFTEPEFPEWENGMQLRKFYKDGRQVRMQNLKNGDVVQYCDLDGKRKRFHVQSDPFLTEPYADARKTWTVAGTCLPA